MDTPVRCAIAATGGAILLDHFRARDIARHQVRRELDAVEAERQASRQSRDHQRLGETRNADQKAVSAGEDGGEELVDDGVLADDDFAHFGLERLKGVVQPLDRGEVDASVTV